MMPYELANASATFQTYITQALSSLLDVCCVVYMNDILIYSENEEQHVKDVKAVLELLRKAKLFVNPKKCFFHVNRIEFLEFVITPEKITMEKTRIEAIEDWPTPKTLKQVQSFIEFTNFYRRFIENFSKIVAPITHTTHRTAKKFQWTNVAESTFQKLKRAFTNASFLIHFDPTQKIEVMINASDYAIGAILQQLQKNGKWHPVTYYSRKLLSAEENYDTPKKKMLAVVKVFKHWRHYLEEAQHKIQLRTDHKNHESFFSKQILSRRQARWAELLSGYDVKINYKSGKKNLADALSRRPDWQTVNTAVMALRAKASVEAI